MKQPKKLTRVQKELVSKLSKKKININDWMLVSENQETITLINKETKELLTFNKRK